METVEVTRAKETAEQDGHELTTYAKKSWTERLFTPENVRILQSLGICIFFISAVAFVRTQMWNDATPWVRVLILCAGTAACSATGYALRRWLSLRITGLGFLILGQLSLVLDAYSSLLDPSGGGIYPYSPLSLWVYSFIFFTITAAFKARLTREPLFDAFTYFGALAAWGAGALWLGVQPAFLPAAFVPALMLSGILAHWITPHVRDDRPAISDTRVPRWSLPWWMGAGFEAGSSMLALALPAVAVVLGRESLVSHFTLHALSIGGLALAMLAGCEFQSSIAGGRMLRSTQRHAAVFLLLTLAPLGAYAFRCPLEIWPAELAIPGALFGLLALALGKRRDLSGVLSAWGLPLAIAGLAGALHLRFDGVSSGASFACAGAVLAVALAYALLRDAVWGPWLAALCLAFLTILRLDTLHATHAYAITIGLALALCSHGLWSLRRADAGKHGRGSADFAALFCAVALVCITPISAAAIAGGPVSLPVSFGWIALFVYAVLTSVWSCTAERRTMSVALASPALAYVLYHAGVSFSGPAPWLAGAALVWVVLARIAERVVNPHGTFLGAAAILAHGALLALFAAAHGSPATASAAFALLALPLLLQSFFVRARRGENWAAVCETAALLLLSAAGINAAAAQQLAAQLWPLALALLAAAALLISIFGELTQSDGAELPDLPFRTPGELTALLLSGAGLAKCADLTGAAQAQPLTLMWVSGLVPLFVAAREIFNAPQQRAGARTVMSFSGAALTAVAALLALSRAIQAEFWSPLCAPALRAACALYFGAMLAVSLAGIWRRGWLAPISAAISALCLLGCGLGAGMLQPQAFGLCCVIVSLAFAALQHISQRDVAFERGVNAALIGTRTVGVAHLAWSLIVLPPGAVHAAPLLAWTLLAYAWSRNAQTRRHAFLASAALIPALAHAMRCAGLAFEQFGPGLAALAVMLEAVTAALRAGVAESSESSTTPRIARSGIQFSAILCAFVALTFGLFGLGFGRAWLWSATLAELALFAAIASIDLRRGRPASGERILSTELLSWLMLICSAVAACGSDAWNVPVTPPMFVLLGALCLALGMAAEGIAAALSCCAQDVRAPYPYLESRHLAALALGLLGLAQAIFLPAHDEPPIRDLWRVQFGLSLLAIYGSFARLSISAAAMEVARKLCAGAAYLVLLPAGYLCFLTAHAHGGNWGAIYLMLLTPVLLAAAAVLRHEKRLDQAELAIGGACLVSLGALVLAFGANSGQLAEVPAATLAAIGAMFVVLRLMTGRARYAACVCGALAGTAFFASQSWIGLELFSSYAPWAWQIVSISLLSVVLIALGGACRIDEAPGSGDSLVAVCGAGLNALALLLALGFLATADARPKFPIWPNTDSFDALIACILLTAAAGLCMVRWLKTREFVANFGRYIAPAATIAGYSLFVLRKPPTAAEWYAAPAAVFLFAWARETILDLERLPESHNAPRERELTLVLILASLLLVLPSFVQALPHTRMGTEHYLALLGMGLSLLFGAMLTRRKVPLLAGAFAIIAGTIVKTVQWAQHREGLWPLLGIIFGLSLLAVSTLCESRMNRAFRKALDKAREEARMFWVSWQ